MYDERPWALVEASVRDASYGLWHEAGRSDAGPVHCPLLPAPLPPLVGGDGLANAGAVAARNIIAAKIPATALRVRDILHLPWWLTASRP